jgi:hypothetical protein
MQSGLRIKHSLSDGGLYDGRNGAMVGENIASCDIDTGKFEEVRKEIDRLFVVNAIKQDLISKMAKRIIDLSETMNKRIDELIDIASNSGIKPTVKDMEGLSKARGAIDECGHWLEQLKTF